MRVSELIGKIRQTSLIALPMTARTADELLGTFGTLRFGPRQCINANKSNYKCRLFAYRYQCSFTCQCYAT